jgi:predicted MFS family arabinose efflux permease
MTEPRSVVEPPLISGTAVVGRGYWSAWAATLAFFAGFYALLVPLPRYLAEAGLPDWQVGLVLGAFGVASLLGRPAAGIAADRWGPRRVMLVGAVALLVGALGVPVTTSLPALFGLRVMQSVGYVAFTTAGTALVVLLSPLEERGRRLAVFGAAANVAITLTPAAMSWLLEIAPLWAGFGVAGLLALLAGGLAARVKPSARADAGTGGWGFPRRLWLAMLTAGLFGAGFAAFFQFAPILAERRGTITAGTLYTVYGISIIAIRVAGAQVIDRLGMLRVLTLAAALMGAGLGMAAIARHPLALGAAAALVAVGGGLFHPALIAHHAGLLPQAPGRASAAFYVGFDLGIGLGSWIFGVALQLGGVEGLYGIATLLVAATVPMARMLTKQHTIRQETDPRLQ